MPGPVEIRRARGSDIGSIVDLRIAFERLTRDSCSFDEAHRRAEIAALLGPDLAAGRLLCWLAEAGGRTVAQAALRLPCRSCAGGEAEILNVFTEPSFRRRGIGAALVAAAIAEARGLGLASLRLQPTEDSRRIYGRAGFRVAKGRMFLVLRRL
jgi:GNAT superfamily N-acetyltransferase